MIYLDHNATTAIDERVLDAMMPYLADSFGNPSSVHRYGRIARAAIDTAREQVAALVNAHPSQVFFTSGGTEANNLALKGFTAANAEGSIAYSAIEHASVYEVMHVLNQQGRKCLSINVDSNGILDMDALDNALAEDIRLVSVIMANNETGVIQDIKQISEQVRKVDAVMHTDAVQAAGKIEVDFKASAVHMMSLSSHKMYGPKGAGALVVDKSLELVPLLHGGGHEKGMRSGTENVAAIVGFGAAAELAANELRVRTEHISRLRKKLEHELHSMHKVEVYAEDVNRLVNTVLLGIEGIDGEALLMNLDRKGIAVSSGSACASGKTEPSHVLTAMGVQPEQAGNAIRISLGKDSTEHDIDLLSRVLQEQVDTLGHDMPAALSS
jgi:cysteine desulfurase